MVSGFEDGLGWMRSDGEGPNETHLYKQEKSDFTRSAVARVAIEGLVYGIRFTLST